MGGHGGLKRIYNRLVGNLKRIHHVGDLYVYGSMILK
jgi:hypothetical protein